MIRVSNVQKPYAVRNIEGYTVFSSFNRYPTVIFLVTQLSKLNELYALARLPSAEACKRGKVMILAIQGTCPYLQSLKEKDKIRCECAGFKFPDKIARREIVYGFCAHPTAYKNCPFKLAMDRYYYERKYANETDEQNVQGSYSLKKQANTAGKREKQRV